MQHFAFDMLFVEELPAPIELVVVIRVCGLPEEFAEGAERTVEVKLRDPGLDELRSMDFEVRTGGPSPDHPEGWEMNTMIPILLQFTALQEGAHSLDFYANGKLQRCPITFRVVEGAPHPSTDTVTS